ncbi:Ort1p KNAG_0B04110 [Huiozyma naganishii CBS 8797]|uniref:Uncharacterized protein n=1 Tax=Huiozyma naganishii (strain ATCC MYA-139 / BCRC 22969 / CBS 8797 / KCTC 17520 / NBRC 10181 / NCYC 3082 / Yp74L-3) TaxID=1071383 RepID=J7RVA8_HUIN7|nr:hypothetical protein KNAG_0B04110 [Kazachstania naganishii CBS 8797]CCK68847.1 hypothetical protein KNAG_0B04110 [Kazachstania naganishii CBS 8797]
MYRALLGVFFAGLVAGCIGKLIDYPFDTVKVRLQTSGSNVFPTTWSCIEYTYKNEGILTGFYQGIESPLLGAALEYATLFTSYNECYKFLEAFTSLSKVYIILISGAVSGSCTSLVLTPVELIKCKLQVSNLGRPVYDDDDDDMYDDDEHGDRNTSLLSTVKSILKQKGLAGLWQGQVGDLHKGVRGYRYLVRRIRDTKSSILLGRIWRATNKASNEGVIYSWQLLVSGGLAGFCFNGLMYPVDTVKSLMQTEHISFKEAVTELRTRYTGLTGFYRGVTITLLRCLPSNAIVFYTHDKLSGLI